MILFSQIQKSRVFLIWPYVFVTPKYEWTSAIQDIGDGFIFFFFLDCMSMCRKDDSVVFVWVTVVFENGSIHSLHYSFVLRKVMQKRVGKIYPAFVIFLGEEQIYCALYAKAEAVFSDYFYHESIISFSEIFR